MGNERLDKSTLRVNRLLGNRWLGMKTTWAQEHVTTMLRVNTASVFNSKDLTSHSHSQHWCSRTGNADLSPALQSLIRHFRSCYSVWIWGKRRLVDGMWGNSSDTMNHGKWDDWWFVFGCGIEPRPVLHTLSPLRWNTIHLPLHHTHTHTHTVKL